MGQGAKPGIGGHLPGAKIVGDVSRTRMVPEGSDAISPAPHHDIYSIEDLRQLVYSLKEATDYEKPVFVKVAAVHNIAAIASGIARSGADGIVIDGFRGGTGAAPTRIRDNVGIPIELALASVDQRLRDEGIRNEVSLIVSGSIRSSADVVKAVALGADACGVATAPLLALGCHLCRACRTGVCNWGIATQDPSLEKRLNPDRGAQRLVNLMRAWQREIDGIHGGDGHQFHRGVARQSSHAARRGAQQSRARHTRRGSCGRVAGFRRVSAIASRVRRGASRAGAPEEGDINEEGSGP